MMKMHTEGGIIERHVSARLAGLRVEKIELNYGDALALRKATSEQRQQFLKSLIMCFMPPTKNGQQNG